MGIEGQADDLLYPPILSCTAKIARSFSTNCGAKSLLTCRTMDSMAGILLHFWIILVEQGEMV
ncbi:MAG TPA: hypothetical protein VJ022_09260, partial [Anaerolineales bacterium]|nr:hypothetical protein [Anaerolineales bacterium]